MFKAAIWPKNIQDWLYFIIVLACLGALILSLVSWLRLCSESCSEVHNWRFLGLPFEYVGALFFGPLLLLLGFAKTNPRLMTLSGFCVAAAAGSELKFISLQKYQIGSWCPVCLSIATCVFIATNGFYSEIRYRLTERENERTTERIHRIVPLLYWVFLLAAVFCLRFDPLLAAENTIKQGVSFGLKDSSMEVYVFTDWACPACRQLEPELEKTLADALSKTRVTFVDDALHTATLNYSPYNVSFMIKNKPEYFKLRAALTALALSTPTPTDAQVAELAQKEGVKYQQLNFADITLSQKYFKQLAKQFGVVKTPTVVIVNMTAKKGKKLSGLQEISASNLNKAIDSLEK